MERKSLFVWVNASEVARAELAVPVCEERTTMENTSFICQLYLQGIRTVCIM